MKQPKIEIKYTKIYKREQAVLRGKFIEINVYINKKEKSNTQPNFITQALEKEQTKPKHSTKIKWWNLRNK